MTRISQRGAPWRTTASTPQEFQRELETERRLDGGWCATHGRPLSLCRPDEHGWRLVHGDYGDYWLVEDPLKLAAHATMGVQMDTERG